MTETYDEYMRAHKEQDSSTVDHPDRVMALKSIRGAAVNAKALTGHENWDRYLGLVQNGLDKAEKDREHYLDLLANASTPSDKIELYRRCLADLTGMAKGLRWVLELPKNLIEAGEEAVAELSME